MILIVSLIFAVFIVWANYTHLDLVTRGSGRVIVAGQNKNVQSPDRGTIKSYLVEEGSPVKAGQIIATINPIEAEGILDEINANISNLKVRLVRLDAELQNQPVSVVEELSSKYPKQLVDAEVELMVSRKAGLVSQLKMLSQESWKKRKSSSGYQRRNSGSENYASPAQRRNARNTTLS